MTVSNLIPADSVIVGIPSLNSAETITTVVATAAEGLRQAGVMDRAVLVNADNGSTDRTREVFSSVPTPVPKISLEQSVVGTGKGTNVLAILNLAVEAGAERIVLLDSDLRSMQPSWIGSLLESVAGSEPMLGVPVYRRNRYEGNTTNHIVSPLIAAVFGVHIQQPIAGDFAFNRAFVQHAVSWTVPESSQLYGIDVHLTANAAREGFGIREVHLGRKIHGPSFRRILSGSQQVIDSLLYAIGRSGAFSKQVPNFGRHETADDVAIRPDSELVDRATRKVGAYFEARLPAMRATFSSLEIRERREWGVRIGLNQWARLLADALQSVANGHGDFVRDDLVALYFYRVMTYWEEIELLSTSEVDALLDLQTKAVVEECQRRRFVWRERSLKFNPGYWSGNL